MQLALPIAGRTLKRRLAAAALSCRRSTRSTYRLFTLLWMFAFVLALAGPIAGFYLRYISPANNSQLLLGSRAGFAVSPRDATIVRFTVGPQARKAGIVAGDHIVGDLRVAAAAKHAGQRGSARGTRQRSGLHRARQSALRNRRRRYPAHRPRSRRPRPRRHGHHWRGSYRCRRSGARHLAQGAELHRSAARARLPVPAVGGVAAASPQFARRRQLGALAGRAADDRRRATVVGLPGARSACRAGSTLPCTTSATSCC